LCDFLYAHLEQFGDPKDAIMKALKHSLSNDGFILSAYGDDENIAGAAVINRTGMEGYIPENILVYIAVDKRLRGAGIGTALMKKVVSESDGDIALHVEYDNPAKRLYEKIGFKSKYAEMRYKK